MRPGATLRPGLLPGAVLEAHGGGPVTLRSEQGRMVVRCAEVLAGPLERLRAGAATDTELEDACLNLAGPAALAEWLDVLGRLSDAGQLVWTAYAGRRALARLVPTAPGFPGVGPAPAAEVRASPLACLRAEPGRGPCLRAPFASARIDVLHPAAAALFARLAQPTATTEASGPAADALLRLFAAAGIVEPAAGPPTRWEFADAHLFARSCLERHDAPRGATGRRGTPDQAPPALRPPTAGEEVVLRRPGPPGAGDPSLAGALAARRSRRAHGDVPMGAESLGELLFRAAAVQSREPPAVAAPYPVAHRPYAGAGACHPLEVYPLVSRCAGLDPGLYHYDAAAHRLTRLTVEAKRMDRLLAYARGTMDGGATPDVVLFVAARFERIAWRYEGLAYALLLAEAGGLLQTFGLLAESLGLAGCAIGAGDAEAFSHAIGQPLAAESCIAAFMVGSRPT